MAIPQHTITIDLAAKRLGIAPRKLQQELLDMQGIQRSEFGFQVTKEWLAEGLAITAEGQRWVPRFNQYRHTTHVEITEAGLSHLRLFIVTPAEKSNA